MNTLYNKDIIKCLIYNDTNILFYFTNYFRGNIIIFEYVVVYKKGGNYLKKIAFAHFLSNGLQIALLKTNNFDVYFQFSN
jgi:hypothetical protein